MESLVVTGGLGFIGSNFIHHILKTRQDISITNVDNVSAGSNLASLKDVEGDPRYKLARGDLADFSFMRKIMSKAGSVVNFAAQTHVDRSIANAEPFFESNVRGVFNLVRLAHEMHLEKVVHISTDEVYGSIGQGSFDERSPLNPSSPYSASKAAADLIVHAWNTTYDLGIVILRCTNNFGPRQHPEKFIPKAIIRGLNGEGIPLYGGGNQVRDWIFVDDFCRAIDLAFEKGDRGEVYNISAGNELSNREVAKRVLKAMGNRAGTLIDVEDRPGHDVRYSMNSGKARLRLGWNPVHTFEEALATTFNWYRANSEWWKPLATKKVLAETPWKERW